MFHKPGVFILGLDTIFIVTVAVNIIVVVVVIRELKIQTFSQRRRRGNPDRLGQRWPFSHHN